MNIEFIEKQIKKVEDELKILKSMVLKDDFVETTIIDIIEIYRDHLSTKARNCLISLKYGVFSRNPFRDLKVITFKDLLIATESELLQTPNLGRKTLKEIKDLILFISKENNRNYRLGMTEDDFY